MRVNQRTAIYLGGKKQQGRSAEKDGSQPAGDVFDWDCMKTCDASALELSPSQLGAGRQDPKAAFRST